MADNLLKDILLDRVLVSDGYTVDFAVGTTYSLDLETLLAVPLIMGFMGDAGEENVGPHVLMEAIEASADRFTIFCNAGCITVPSRNTRMYSLLENCVNQVTLPARGKGFVNFHPKVWIVRQTNTETGETKIKVSVMSRNLTASADMDVVCVLEGAIMDTRAPGESLRRHKPLQDFIMWLADKSNVFRRRDIVALADILDYVHEFELDDKRFDSYDFFPIGISGEYDGMKSCLLTPEFTCNLNRAVVISPFIDKSVLLMLSRPGLNGLKTLITRRENVGPEILEMFNDGVYAVKDTLKEETEGAGSLDLHMKMYFVNARGWNYLYLGSANATRNAFSRNVEFMLRLRFGRYQMSYDKFREEFINDRRDCRFEQVTSSAPMTEETFDNVDESIIRQIASSICSAKVSENGNGTFQVKVAYKELCVGRPVFLTPLQAEGMRVEMGATDTTFDGLRLVELSDFYIITVGSVSRIISIPTAGVPAQERDTAIFRSYINTPEKFLNYVNFMLAEDKDEYIGELTVVENPDGITGCRSAAEMTAGLYENMLRIACSDSERIRSIARIMDKVNAEVVPDGFARLYSQFENAIRHFPKL